MINTQKVHGVAKAATLTALAMGLVLSSANCASRADEFAQKHPRRAEVLRRDGRINRRINRDAGHLGGHYGQLEHQDIAIRQQEQRDARANGGYITGGQQGQLNREEGALSKETYFDNKNNKFVQNHPRRAEVLGRDANLNYQINKDEGHLGGNYGRLEREDKSIAHQEQRDASMNDGHITKQEQNQLNREENSLNRQINRDDQ